MILVESPFFFIDEHHGIVAHDFGAVDLVGAVGVVGSVPWLFLAGCAEHFQRCGAFLYFVVTRCGSGYVDVDFEYAADLV